MSSYAYRLISPFSKIHTNALPTRIHYRAYQKPQPAISPLVRVTNNGNFQSRHIGPRDGQETDEMLKICKVSSFAELVEKTIPNHIRYNKPLDIDPSLSEAELLELVKNIGAKNQSYYKSLIGMGYYNCYTPTPILRNVLENPAWYTPYTPYQAEISQGRMQSLFNFQSMIAEMTGLDIANASLLDESTAAAEAMLLSMRYTKRKLILIDERCHPQTTAVVSTRGKYIGANVSIVDIMDPNLNFSNEDLAGVLVQYPDTQGTVIDFTSLAEKLHDNGSLLAVATDLLALTLLKAPGDMGADIAIGTSQRFGVPIGYGGPHAGFLSVNSKLSKQIPGRIIGISRDQQGKPVYRLALQSREQHIRKDKATSNICTAQALLANISTFYAIYHGPEGLKDIAGRIHYYTCDLAASLHAAGLNQSTDLFFDTLVIECSAKQREEILNRAEQCKVNLRIYPGDYHLGVSLDETVTQKDVNQLKYIFTGDENTQASFTSPIRTIHESKLARESPFLIHPIFNSYHSETSLMRYIRSLEILDYGLMNGMIPLGSCTLKLNAATEMVPITMPEFANMHPFVPISQAAGYKQIMQELEHALIEFSGYDKICFQSNSGAQGEYSGLCAIRKYLESQGQYNRRICLIPSSAHGTNPASATMAGLKVITIESDAQGSTNVEDLRYKLDKYSDDLAAAMITYPSTNGVFEENITDICDLIHQAGGQVYIDGANMNAQVGLTRPGDYGGDVSHFNLHKTFCIPHGGGGPGMGPIGVKKHLIPFLPTHPLVDIDGRTNQSLGCISSSPFGSSLILLISWAYIKMMGGQGLKRASEMAILNSNYMREKLAPHFKILFQGTHGFTAHEVLIDCRQLKKQSGIDATDIAKRLQDYGFHAPTIQWPVHNTLMIEPTESENREEMDKFCDSLIQIKSEIDEVIDGKYSIDDNVLRNAPHPKSRLTSDNWAHIYSRTKAAYPLSWINEHKFWPNCSRVDDAYGDRNPVLTLKQSLMKNQS